MKKIFTLSLMALMAIAMIAQTYPTRVYLCGPAGPGWVTQNWPMYTYLQADSVSPTGIYEWIGDLNDGDLKLLHGTQFEPGFSPVIADTLSYGSHSIFERLSYEDPDNKWSVTAGRYKLVLSLIDSTLTISDGTDLPGKNGEGQSFDEPAPGFVYPVGDGCSFGWNPGSSVGIAKSEGADIFEADVFLTNGEFKLLHQADWGAQYGPVTNGEVISGAGSYSLCKPSGDNKWKIEGITDLTPFHMVANVSSATLTLAAMTWSDWRPDVLYMVGNGTGAGWDPASSISLSKTGESIYTLTTTIYGHNTEEDYNEFKILSSQSWAMPQLGPAVNGEEFKGAGTYSLSVFTTGDNKWYNTTTETKNYVFTLDLSNNSMVVTEESGTGLINSSSARGEGNNVNANANKVLRNGKLYIQHNEKIYTATGARAK